MRFGEGSFLIPPPELEFNQLPWIKLLPLLPLPLEFQLLAPCHSSLPRNMDIESVLYSIAMPYSQSEESISIDFSF